MNRSESIKEKLSLTEKMLLVYGKVKSIHKTGKIGLDKNDKDKGYKVVTHDEVTRVLHEAFAEVGIVCLPSQKSCIISEYQSVTTWNGKDTVKTGYKAEVTIEYTFINASDPKDTLTSVATAFAMDPSDKAIGKAYSMAVKMILLKTFMLESTDEEEARTTEDGTSYNETKAMPHKEPTRVPVTKSEPNGTLGNYKLMFTKRKGCTVEELYNEYDEKNGNTLRGLLFWLSTAKPPLSADALEFQQQAESYLKLKELTQK